MKNEQDKNDLFTFTDPSANRVGGANTQERAGSAAFEAISPMKPDLLQISANNSPAKQGADSVRGPGENIAGPPLHPLPGTCTQSTSRTHQ